MGQGQVGGDPKRVQACWGERMGSWLWVISVHPCPAPGIDLNIPESTPLFCCQQISGSLTCKVCPSSLPNKPELFLGPLQLPPLLPFSLPVPPPSLLSSLPVPVPPSLPLSLPFPVPVPPSPLDWWTER